MLRWRRCECGEKPSHTERIPTMSGDIMLYYCEKCYREIRKSRQILAEEREKQREEQREKQKLEAEKQARYEYLKREVELAELEKRAKELGIE